ncbi:MULTISPECIES: hypothetical protein [Enterococcus]|uniref:hypothetical protein n=1 Tax=Enterococcus TaxID=1350 RepID=UPI000352B57D|nr:phage head-tail adapter protein [Enterococcus faecium]EPI26157.1 hypothetical protein D352_00131 [Enterococcus faecium LA4B-2]GMB97169.1 hypothetical protein K2D_01830 [Enterococcus hirae]GMC07656.1 hypothetical protein K4F_26620 [Enterococcus hirae]
MAINPNYKKSKIVAGDLNIPVTFFSYEPNDSPDPGEKKKNILYECTALIYNPSMKDITILESKGTKEGLTIKIRDPLQSYVPNNKHKVEIKDYRCKFESGGYKHWEIIDVSPDFESNNLIKIVLGVTT